MVEYIFPINNFEFSITNQIKHCDGITLGSCETISQHFHTKVNVHSSLHKSDLRSDKAWELSSFSETVFLISGNLGNDGAIVDCSVWLVERVHHWQLAQRQRVEGVGAMVDQVELIHPFPTHLLKLKSSIWTPPHTPLVVPQGIRVTKKSLLRLNLNFSLK